MVKLNAGLVRLPTFPAAGEVDPHRAMLTVTPGLDGCQEAYEACRRGEPRIGFAELYFQTAYDPRSRPPGRHTMSVFAHYAPYELSRRRMETPAATGVRWSRRRSHIWLGQRLALEDVAAGEPDPLLDVGRAEHLDVLDAVADVRGVDRDRVEDQVRRSRRGASPSPPPRGS